MNIIKSLYFKAYLILKYGIHWNKPLYQLKLLKNLIRAKFYKITGSKKFVLRGIDFAVTYKCNFNCDHCYAQTLEKKKNYTSAEPCPREVGDKNHSPSAQNLVSFENKKEELLTVEDYSRIARQAMKLGTTGFSFQGGEPFLRKNWPDVIKAFKPWENHITITTNGSLITEKITKKMKEVGVDTVYFSIDSGIAEEHDRFRKHPESFKKIMKAIELVKKYRMKVAINTTVSRDNLYSEGFKKILDFSNQNKIMHETIFARPLGNWKDRVELMLSEEDIEYYYNLRKNYPFVVRDLDNNYGKWGCPAVKEVLYITCYGDVCPCPYSHVSLGNIKNEDLAVIRQRGLDCRWYSHYHEECLTALDREFLGNYLPKVGEEGIVSIKDIDNAVI